MHVRKSQCGVVLLCVKHGKCSTVPGMGELCFCLLCKHCDRPFSHNLFRGLRRTHSQGNASAVPDAKPEEGPYWSLMFEVSESELKPVNNEAVDLAGEEPIPICSHWLPTPCSRPQYPAGCAMHAAAVPSCAVACMGCSYWLGRLRVTLAVSAP